MSVPEHLIPPTGDVDARRESYSRALRSAIQKRDYAVDDKPGFIIRGYRIQWYFYEPSFRRKVALTKKELKSRDFTSRVLERGWKDVFVPSGKLKFVFQIDGRGEKHIAESKRRLFDIDSILDRIDKLANEIAERKLQYEREAAEARRRAAERAKSRRVEDYRWNAMHDMLTDFDSARRLRRLIDRVAKQTPVRPDQARRVRKWVRWATVHADDIDPMTKDFDIVLSRLGLPRR